jgi:hypothetical protein
MDSSVLADLEVGENAVPLAELRDQSYVPRRHGKKLDKSVPFRWVKSGIKGIKLEAVKAGGVLVTTKSATLRFFAKLSGPTSAPPARTSRRRERGVTEAERELAGMGLK